MEQKSTQQSKWEKTLNEIKDINFKDKTTKHKTWLFIAVEENNLPLVHWLLARGAKPDLGNLDKITPLHVACHLGNLDIVKALVESGADLLAFDSNGRTPFHVAAVYGRLEILKYCLQEQSQINKAALLTAKDNTLDGRTALHDAACNRNNANVCRYLIAQGADVNVRNKYNYTPLHFAAKHGQHQVSEALLDVGADPSLENDYQQKPADMAAQLKHPRLAEQLRAAVLVRLVQSQMFTSNNNTQILSPLHVLEQTLADVKQEMQILKQTLPAKTNMELSLERNLQTQAQQLQTMQQILEAKMQELQKIITATTQTQPTTKEKLAESVILSSDENTDNALQSLQAQLNEVVIQQQLLTDSQKLKQQKQDAIAHFHTHPNLLLFYKTFQIKLEEVFISAKAASGGFVETSSGSLSSVKNGIELLGESISLAPVVGDTIDKIIQMTIGKVLETIDSERQANTVKSISMLMTLNELRKIGERVARELTQCYEPQLLKLLTPEQELKRVQEIQSTSKVKKLVGRLNATKNKLLKASAIPNVQKLAEYAVAIILEALKDQLIDPQQSLDEQITMLITIPEPIEGVALFETDLAKKLGRFQLHTVDNRIWYLNEFYIKVGIQTEKGQLFAGESTDIQLYGYCNSTEEVANARGLSVVQQQMTSNDSHPATTAQTAIVPPLPSLTSLINRITELENRLSHEIHKREALESRLAQLEAAPRIATNLEISKQTSSIPTTESLTVTSTLIANERSSWSPGFHRNVSSTLSSAVTLSVDEEEKTSSNQPVI